MKLWWDWRRARFWNDLTQWCLSLKGMADEWAERADLRFHRAMDDIEGAENGKLSEEASWDG